MQFGEKIRILRQQADMTQPELADRLNIEQSWLSKIETGKVVPSSEFIQAVLNYFQLTLDELIGDLDIFDLKAHLGAVPEIATYLYLSKAGIHQKRKHWSIVSALLCAVGGALLMLASQNLLFPPNQYLYHSEGLIYFGEPLDLYSDSQRVFEILDLDRIPRETNPAGPETEPLSARSKLAEFEQYVLTRRSESSFVSNFDRGEYIIDNRFVPLDARNIYGNEPQAAQRVLNRRPLENRNPYNSLLHALGFLLLFLGLAGFVIEFKLSKLDN
ncbi:MAG: helix-turn-helix transcriptional regulator [Pseudohongiellaceae bacterium]